jgi:8-oxo-dGTP diphosphatase
MLKQPQVGVGVVVRRGDHVLLLKRGGVRGAGTWSTPGGHLEYGESPEECAIREVKEETAVDITGVEFKAVTNDIFEVEGKHYLTLWFDAIYIGGEAAVAAPDEMTEVGWFEWDELPTPLFLPFQNLLGGNCFPRLDVGMN